MSHTIVLAICMGVVAFQLLAFAGRFSSERTAVERSGAKRAEAALDMLASVHTQAMMHRTGIDGNDGAIATLNGTMEQFSESGSDVRLWVVMAPKVMAFQKSLNGKGSTHYDLELPRDAIDQAVLTTATTHRKFSDVQFRETRPIIYGQGRATAAKCGGCHETLMGIRPGEIMGAYSASVGLAAEKAIWWSNIKTEVMTNILLGLALIALMIMLLRSIALRPIEKLTQSTNLLANGALDVAIEGDQRPDEIGDLARALKIFRDNLAEKRVLEIRNCHDEMTGLPNRASFAQFIEVEIAAAIGTDDKIALIGIDLNGFKEVNDRHGHATGDALLIELSKRARRSLHENGIIARFGGDEFVAAKRFRAPEELAAFLDRIEDAVTQPIRVGELMIAPGASFGVAVYPNDGTETEQLIANADLAMYRAKADANTNVCHYEAVMDERARARRLLAADIRSALGEKQFVVHYQPQNCIRTGAIIGYEALLRWTHHDLGPICPSEFVAIAEENGEIVRIGDWVLKTACAEAASWDNELKIAVNLSAVQLGMGDLARRVHEILIETGLPPRRLELEITETAIVRNRDRAVGILRMIKTLGVSIAIDDFGAGYSSLATLNAFPFDKIKMDRSFLLEAEKRPEARAIIRAIVAIGKSLNVPVLAEGVETEAQRAFLVADGCDEAQGFLYGRPQAHPVMPNKVLPSDAVRARNIQRAG